MGQQAAATAAPGAPGDKQAVRCKNPDCELHRFRQFMTKDGLCRRCKWKLPSSVAIQGAPSVPRPRSAEMAMQLALGERLKEDKVEPF
jgi:hypothetical protein